MMKYDKYCAVSLVLQVLGRHLVRVCHGHQMSTRRHAIKLPAPAPLAQLSSPQPPYSLLVPPSSLPLTPSLFPPSSCALPTPLLSPSSIPFSPSPLPSSPLSHRFSLSTSSSLTPLPEVDDSLSFEHGCRKCIHLRSWAQPCQHSMPRLCLLWHSPNLSSSLGQVVR